MFQDIILETVVFNILRHVNHMVGLYTLSAKLTGNSLWNLLIFFLLFCAISVVSLCDYPGLSVSSARSGRQLGRPGRRRRPAGPPTWRNAKANKQETILSQHSPVAVA